MTKKFLLDLLCDLDDSAEIDLDEIANEIEQARLDRIAEIEERQHNSGFYVFQDMMDRRRMER